MSAIEVVYATRAVQAVVPLEVPAGCTVETVIERSRLLARFPEIDLQRNKVGIFGECVSLDRTVSEGDRVEIYRPLQISPQQARRGRARGHRHLSSM